jgi:hypothetical protein
MMVMHAEVEMHIRHVIVAVVGHEVALMMSERVGVVSVVHASPLA